MENDKITFKLKKYLPILILLIFVFLIAIYLSSADNLTGILYGDGYFHSLFADNIFQQGKIEYEWQYRLFDGLKIGGEVQHYPIHYTQIFHLSLGLFNNLLGLDLFSWGFTFFINFLIVLFTYLIVREDKILRVVLPGLVILTNSIRFLAINFMEGYLLLVFLLFLYSIKKHFQSKKKRGTKYIYLASFFLGYLMITKHMGLFDGALILFIFVVIKLLEKNFLQLLKMCIIIFCVTFGPLFSVWKGIGTIGYGTSSFKLPRSIPFSEYLSETFLTSKYKYPGSTKKPKLSYQVDRDVRENFNKISNITFLYGNEGFGINWIFIILIIIGLISKMRSSFKLGIILLATFVFEFLILNWQNLMIIKYNIILIFLVVYFLFRGISIFKSRNRQLHNLVVISFVILNLFFFFTLQHSRLFRSVGRKTYEMEVLYKELGEYLNSDTVYDGEVFLASSPQFGYWAKKDYMWYPYIYSRPWEKELDIVRDYYDIRYIIITSDNLKSNGLYDKILPDRHEEIVCSDDVKLRKRFQNETSFIELWEL